MSKKLFEPVEFPEADWGDLLPPQPDNFPDITLFQKPLAKLQSEIGKYQRGCSTIRSGAIQFTENRKIPVLVAIRRFEENPCDAELVRLFGMVRQDLGTAFHDALHRWVFEIYPDVPIRTISR